MTLFCFMNPLTWQLEVMQRRRKFNPHRFFHLVKFYAIEIGATIIFLSWVIKEVAKEVAHNLGF